jgi:hypothetical protein
MTHSGKCPLHFCESHTYRVLKYNLETNRMQLSLSCSQCLEVLDPVSYCFTNL